MTVKLDGGEIYIDGEKKGEYGVVLTPKDPFLDKDEISLEEGELYISYIQVGGLQEEDVVVEGDPKKYIRNIVREEME